MLIVCLFKLAVYSCLVVSCLFDYLWIFRCLLLFALEIVFVLVFRLGWCLFLVGRWTLLCFLLMSGVFG